MTQKNTLEEIDIRMKDFQEVTFFTTRAGRPLPALAGIVDFLSSSDWEYKNRADISLSGSSAVLDYMDHTLRPQTDRFQADTDSVSCANDTSAYRFLSGMPVSFFYSSTAEPKSSAVTEERHVPETVLPEGSENIDDLL